MQTFETIIVGGGPAGSSCAWMLKKQNRDVALLDASAFPRTKLCAGWVTPKVLADLDLSPDVVPGLVELNKMNLHWKSSKRSFPMPSKQYSIRRSEFDHFLLKRSNVTTIEHRVRNIHHDGEYYIIDNAFRCTYLVGAGGTQCPVKKSLFPEIQQRRDGIALARELEQGNRGEIA